jgi:hypothetical protein
MPTPEQVVQAQLDAYDARDIDGFVATYHPDIVIADLANDLPLISGHDELRERYTAIFEGSPDLHLTVKNQIVAGHFVIVHEYITGRLGETLDTVLIYEVKDDLITHVWFVR